MRSTTSPSARRTGRRASGPFAGDVGGLDDGAGRRTAGAHDQAGADVGNVVFGEAGILDRLIHGDVVPGGAAAVEAHGAAVDHGRRIELRRAVDAAAETEPGVVLGGGDAGLRLAQTRGHLLGGVPDGGDDAHAGDDNALHDLNLSPIVRPGGCRGCPPGLSAPQPTAGSAVPWKRPTFRSFAR